MGKTSKWLRGFLTGKKDKEKEKAAINQAVSENSNAVTQIPQVTQKEKGRWSFRRSSAATKEVNSVEQTASTQPVAQINEEDEQRKHAMAMAVATAAAAEAAVAAAQAAAAVMRLKASTANGKASTSAIEEAAAIKIQSVFRSHLARKALSALRGLVKLQALVRGHLVRKQATATLRCIQALVMAQDRARVQRIRMAEDTKSINSQQSNHRKSTHDNRFMCANHEIDRGLEENIKIVEMDLGDNNAYLKNRSSYSGHSKADRQEHRFSTYSKDHSQLSPDPSVLTELTPRTIRGHVEDYYFSTAESSPQLFSAVSKPNQSHVPPPFPRSNYSETLSYDYPLYPNYMANTESSRAKVRSHSAPKSRPDAAFDRQPSRRKATIEGRNIPRAVRMQRSSSHLSSTAQNLQYPWSIKLDKSTVSLQGSECGSTSTVLTNTNYCRSVAAYEGYGNRY